MVYKTGVEKIYEEVVKKVAKDARLKGESVREALQSSEEIKKAELAMSVEHEKLSPDMPDYVGCSVFGFSWGAALAG